MPPDVYLDLTIGTAAPARITISLFTTETPTTCSNFRLLCTNRAPLPTYLSTPIHRIIPTFMLQGGDTTAGNGTGGKSAIQPDGGAIPDENLHWRAIDEPGLVCMANRGKDTGTSQFFITCDAAEWLSGKHTVFGKVVGGMEVVREVERVSTEGDVPVVPVVVAGCGEVEVEEKKRERKRHRETVGEGRGENKIREGVDDAGLDGAADSPERERGERRRHRRHRSRSPRRGTSPRGERRYRDRSRDRDHRRHDRRERGHRHEDAEYVRDDQDAEERIRREEREREAVRRYDDEEEVGEKKGKVTFKGRGSMKYRENKGWGVGGGGRLD